MTHNSVNGMNCILKEKRVSRESLKIGSNLENIKYPEDKREVQLRLVSHSSFAKYVLLFLFQVL